jgi:polyisoprenoid-binding protein YceI
MKSLFLGVLFLISPLTLFGQSYTLDSAQSQLTIEGTSNVHDWVSTAEEYTSTAAIVIEDNRLVSISSLQFEVTVDEIKSGKKGMDTRTYDALNEKSYPTISFLLDEISSISNESLEATGSLTISGKTQPIQMSVNYQLLEGDGVQFSGRQSINMRDYGVEPPTAMFGAIAAGEEVQVVFTTIFVKK